MDRFKFVIAGALILIIMGFGAPPVEADTVHYTLCVGQNLISMPLEDLDLITADLLLADICHGKKVDSVWKWDAPTASFVSWNILDMGTGWFVEVGMPIWVNVADPRNGCKWMVKGTMLTGLSYDLIAGLNLVSLPVYSTSIVNASDLLADIPDCTGVWRWSREDSCKNAVGFDGFFSLSDPSEDFPLMHGGGYWVSVSTAGTWTPPNP